MKEKPVLVLDKQRGVHFGYLVREMENGNAVQLKNMRNCFYWVARSDHNKGVYSLASHGPVDGSKVGPRVNGKIRDVSKIIDVTDEAVKKWEEAIWM